MFLVVFLDIEIYRAVNFVPETISQNRINHLLLAGGVLDRLYVTLANRLLGGRTYASILDGELLDPPADLKINNIYYDTAGVDGLGQLFVVYDRA